MPDLSGVFFVGLVRETEGDGDGGRLVPPAPFSVAAMRTRNGVALDGVLTENRPGIGQDILFVSNRKTYSWFERSGTQNIKRGEGKVKEMINGDSDRGGGGGGLLGGNAS